MEVMVSRQVTFEPFRAEIRKGTTLVEASAGTGKTYTLVTIVLRAVVELEIPIDQVLVVTFTIAATNELRERIRQRLSQARRLFKNRNSEATTAEDPELYRWLTAIENPDRAVQLLNLALLDIDRAAIHTIHGFCQKTLREQALESGQPFDVELTGDTSQIRIQLVQDYWRKRIYSFNKRYCSLVISAFKSPEKLYKTIQGAENVLSELVPAQLKVAELCDRLDAILEKLRSWWLENGEILTKQITDAINGGFLKTAAAGDIAVWLEQINFCLTRDLAFDPAALAWLQHDSLVGMLNGTRLRGDDKKNAFIADWSLPGKEYTLYLDSVTELLRGIRLELAQELRTGIARRMREQAAMSFDDLIIGLARAVSGRRGRELCRQVQERYRIALIDEFQDTDSAQWKIFSRLFTSKNHYLYLIGDPKQAIYRFRGADIFSYFSARDTVANRLTLSRNFRSNPGLMSGVNRLFANFEIGGVKYQAVVPARSAEDGRLAAEQGRELSGLLYCHLAPRQVDVPGWPSGDGGEVIRAWVVSEVADLIFEKSSIRIESGGTSGEPESRRIVPADIAILVRTHKEAELYQNRFRHIGVSAVITSKTVVFSTEECTFLLLVLQSIASPGHEGLLKTALSCNWFGLSGDEHFRICSNSAEFASWQERFLDYNEMWKQAGFLPMMDKFLKSEQVAIRLCRSPGAERRISNIEHLAELIQEAEQKSHYNMSQTLLWLQEMASGKHQLDEVELRLESDADALRIITMHSAKGLEFPVVFCPSLLSPSYHSDDVPLVHCHLEDGTRICDLGSAEFERNKAQALAEERQEDLRIAYVAITRAQLRCYVIWAEIKAHQTRPSSLESPLGRLLFPVGTASFAEQKKHLESISAPPHCEYRLIDNEEVITGYRGASEITGVSLQPQVKLERILRTNRTRTSFSGLARISDNEDREALAGAFDEAEGSTATLLDSAYENIAEPGLPDYSKLGGGVRLGNVVHDVLEQIKFTDLAEGRYDREQLQLICRRHNLDADHDVLGHLLENSVRSPLLAGKPSDSFTLADLSTDSIVKEMEFTLHLSASSTQTINDLLADDPCFSPLSTRMIEGYLTGYIDLICEYDGRYYVIDYKTNYIGETADFYSPPSLQAAMRHHNYGLQYWLYTLVVHRHLQRWLPAYRYSVNFGGVMYLFVRGMTPGLPGRSVFSTVPDEQTLKQLDKSFGTV